MHAHRNLKYMQVGYEKLERRKKRDDRGLIERMKLGIEGRGEKRSDRKNEGRWQSEDTSMRE